MTRQETLGGNAVDIQNPSTTDKHRGCIAATGEPNNNGNKTPHGVTPYLTAVTSSGVRSPYCKTHAREEWIAIHEQTE